MMSILYDTFFSIIVFIALFSFVNSVNTGTYYWRQYYVEDVSLSLSLIEGIPEDLSVNYVVTHTKALSNAQTGLFVEINPGFVTIYSRNETQYKTIRPFITKQTSNLHLLSPLEAISIFKSGNEITFSGETLSQCRTLSRDKREFVLTKIYLPDEDIPNRLKEVILQTKTHIDTEYGIQLGSYQSLYTQLLSENIIDKQTLKQNNDLSIILLFKEADQDAISVKYATKGDSKLANNVACNIFSQLEYMYSEIDQYENQDLNLFIRPASSGEVNEYMQENNAVVLIEFQSVDFDNFYLNNYIFSKVIVDNIKKSTNKITQEKINQLLS